MPPFQDTIELRWSDLDPRGQVNPVVVLDLAQETRARFMVNSSHPQLLTEGSVVAKQAAEFLHPMNLDNGPVRVELSTASIGAARFVMSYDMFQGTQLCVRASTVMCPFDFPNQCVRKLTAGERNMLSAISAPNESWPTLPAVNLADGAIEGLFQPRWSDQDPYGHVNNVATLDWLQASRIEATAQMAGQSTRRGNNAASGHGAEHWAVVRQDTQYRQQLSWQLEPYRMRTGVLRIGTSSLTLGSQIIDPSDGTVHVLSQTVLVRMGGDGHAQQIPEDIRAQLENYLSAKGQTT